MRKEIDDLFKEKERFCLQGDCKNTQELIGRKINIQQQQWSRMW